jgi:glycosyltransferase involved in cell wall biosynthesis
MIERLRIAMVAACPFPWPRGTPIRIFRLAEALAQRGHELHVFTYHLGEPTPNPPFAIHRIRNVASYTRTAPGPSLRKLVQLNPMLSRLLATAQQNRAFDVVHGHHYEGILTAAHASAAAPIIYDAHTTLAGELPYYYRGLPAWFKRWTGGLLDRRLPRRAAYTIAVSETIRKHLLELGAVRHENVCVIPNGVDWHLFDVPVSAKPRGEMLIFTGNLSKYQGIDLMLHAFTKLHMRRPGVRLLIVTDSSFEPFEILTRKLGVAHAIDVRSVHFAEQPSLLAQADVAINPRVDCDGIPQKLLNYMAAGKPIVSFNGSAVHLEHGRTGLRIADGDTGAMADAIERLLDDRALAERLGRAARQQVQHQFSWDGVAQRVEQVYREVLDKWCAVT